MITFRNVSVIIPVGPGENALEVLRGDLRPIEKEAEIIVIRGSHRAQQLNEGARKAARRFLWFLHADSRFSSKTLPALLRSLNRHPEALHYFNLRFLPDGPPLMFLNEAGCWIRSRVLGVPFGDQGFCVSKENFEKIGGFPEDAPYGEDHLFVWKVRQKEIRLRCTGAVLKTSARRYAETGWARLTWTYACRWTQQAWPGWRRKVPGLLRGRGPEGARHLSLIIFAKYPEAGKVKSRLAKTIGESEAAEAYKKMVERVVEQTKPRNGEYDAVLYFDPPEYGDRFYSWLGFAAQRPQWGSDLGERMKNALAEAFAGAERVVLIGTDCMAVDRPLILEAFAKLDHADLALGPAEDGGYYLVGMRKHHAGLFDGIIWSTSEVFSQTLAKARQLGLQVATLPKLSDVDSFEDYQRIFLKR